VALWGLRRLGHRSVRLVLDTDDWEQAWNDILSYSTLQKRLFAWQEIWGLRHADAVTVASRALEQWVRRYRDGASPGVHYLPNGYSPIKEEARLSLTSTTPQVVREQWRLDSAPTVLLYSRFLEFRLGRVVALVGQVARQLPQARWLIVGRGLNGEEKELERQVNQAGLGRYVNFTGWLPLDQLPAYFQAADVAIFPYDDTWLNRTKCSIKLIDLLSTGLPVVADAVGQNCEYIQHNKTGILAPAGDDVAFGQALVELLQSPDQRRRLGQAAARAIREQFDWLQLAQSVERAYH
jgi:glycosyltransferase involved in cell wall biosynthesis